MKRLKANVPSGMAMAGCVIGAKCRPRSIDGVIGFCVIAR